MKVIEISKKDLKHNLDIIRRIIENNGESKKTKIIAVVKANGVRTRYCKIC